MDNVLELYTVPSGGGTPVKLNGALVNGGDVVANRLRFSPDGSHVLYVADQQTDGALELFIVPSTGGTSVKLNGPLPPQADVDISTGSLHFTPDGSRVVYLADQQIDNVTELYSVPSIGGTPTNLNGSLVPGGDVYWAMPSPDGSRVAYKADQDTDNTYELYSVPIAGGPSVKLSAPLVGGGEVFHFSVQFTPDGSRVLYTADPIGPTLPETYIVPAAGGTPIKLGERVSVGDAEGEWPVLSPDGSQVIYRADPDMNGGYDLYARVVTQQWIGGSADWDSAAHWSHALLPDEAMQVILDTPGTTTITPAAIGPTVSELHLGGGASPSVLYLEPDATLSAINGVRVESNGVLQGDGRIEGAVTIASGGRIAPGSSAGTFELAELMMDADSMLDLEIGGLGAGSDFDQLVVDGTATLDGMLNVSLLGEYLPSESQEFIVLTADEIFDSGIVLAGPAAGLFDLTVAGTFVALQFVGGLPGDYNGDHVVDAADYTVWRDAMEGGGSLPGDTSPESVSEDDYDVWREHFGQTLEGGIGSGNAAHLTPGDSAEANYAVPEPAALTLCYLASCMLLSACRRLGRTGRST